MASWASLVTILCWLPASTQLCGDQGRLMQHLPVVTGAAENAFTDGLVALAAGRERSDGVRVVLAFSLDPARAKL
jgi:hypothetical protein